MGIYAAIRSFPVPVGGFGDPRKLADWMVFMLSDAADFLCGSIVFVDGGTDAYFRADDWPHRMPTTALPRYLWRVVAFRRRRAATRRPLTGITIGSSGRVR